MPKFERIIPILVYEDIPSAHDFLIDAFGFASGGVQRTPDGVAVHGEVRAGDLVIWLHRATPEHNLASPRSQAAIIGASQRSSSAIQSVPQCLSRVTSRRLGSRRGSSTVDSMADVPQ